MVQNVTKDFGKNLMCLMSFKMACIKLTRKAVNIYDEKKFYSIQRKTYTDCMLKYETSNRKSRREEDILCRLRLGHCKFFNG